MRVNRKVGMVKRVTAFSAMLGILVSCVSPSFAYRREELVFAYIPIVYSAAKIEQRADEAPATVDVITSGDIEGLGLRTLADALRLIPGMDVTDVVVTVNFSMRGLNGRQWNNTTLVLMDGHPFNEIVGGHSDPTCIPLNNVDRIEVVRGPGSSLYGANAMTGVINIITKSPADVNGVTATVGAGTQEIRNQEQVVRTFGSRLEQNKQSLLFGKQYGDLGLLASFWRYRNNSVGAGGVSPNDDRDDVEYYGKAQYKNLVLAYNRLNVDMGVPNLNPLDGSPFLEDRTTFRRDYVSLDYKQDAGRNLVFNLRSHYYQTAQTDKHSDLTDISVVMTPAGPAMLFEWGIVERPFDGKRVGVELQSTYKAFDRHLLIAGYERRDEISDTPSIGNSKRIVTDSFFVQDEWRPLEKLILTLGARYDKANAYKEKISPRGSAVYKLTDQTTLKGSYGEAYRAPNFLELYADIWMLAGNYRRVGDPEIQPEELRTSEVGLTHSFSKAFQANVNLFYTEIRNRIIPLPWRTVVDPTHPFGGYNLQEYGTRELADIKGGELGLKYLHPIVEADLNYSYQEAFDRKEGFRLAYSPNKVNLRLKFNLGSGVTLNTLSYFNHEVNINPQTMTENVFVSNAKINWEATKNLSLALASYNVFDRQYSETPGVPLAGRSVLAEAGYKFGF